MPAKKDSAKGRPTKKATKKATAALPLDRASLERSVEQARHLEERASLMRQDLLFLDVDDDGSGWPLFTPVELVHGRVEVGSHEDDVLTLRHHLRLDFVRIDDPEDPDYDDVEELFASQAGEENEATLGWLQYQQRWWLPEAAAVPRLATNLFAMSTASAQLTLSIHPFANEIVRQLGRGSLGPPHVQSAEAKRQYLRGVIADVLGDD